MFSIFRTAHVKSEINTRTSGPAVSIYYYDNRKKKMESWLSDAELHRVTGPAVIYYNSHGTKVEQDWFVNGERHRLSGPAFTSYYPNNGMKKEEIWL